MSKLAGVVGLLIVICAAAACASNSPATTPPAATPAATAPGATKTCDYPADGSTPAKVVSPPPAIEPASGTVVATLTINSGKVQVKMDKAKAPCTVGSFVHLAQAGYFDSTRCHRLTASASLSVLQCGDPTGTGEGGPGYQFADETTPDMTYPAGTVAMANAGPNTNGSQFFLVYADSTLPPSYTVFGTIVGGLDTLTTIAKAGVSGGGSDGAPAEPVTIKAVTLSP